MTRHEALIEISGGLYERLREIADNDGRSISGIVESVIRRDLDREDIAEIVRRQRDQDRRERYYRDRLARDLTSGDVDVHAFGSLAVCTYRRQLVAIGVFPPGGTHQVDKPLLA